MKILIIAVGRISVKSSEGVILGEYLKRLPWQIEVREIEEEDGLKRTSEKILKAVPNGYVPILLDKDGKNYSSEEFASYLDKISIAGSGKIAFLIGASDGFHENIYKEVRNSISFGKMTYAHKLARIILAEQLYRAWAISVGHPYHK
jgi:23S rRNA (pseudouridine1915-N3)-methyltransferase